MRRVTIEVECQDLARAASGAPGLSFDAVVRQALQEYALRHRRVAGARVNPAPDPRRLRRETDAPPPPCPQVAVVDEPVPRDTRSPVL